jgi:hypothetical protein
VRNTTHQCCCQRTSKLVRCQPALASVFVASQPGGRRLNRQARIAGGGLNECASVESNGTASSQEAAVCVSEPPEKQKYPPLRPPQTPAAAANLVRHSYVQVDFPAPASPLRQ